MKVESQTLVSKQNVVPLKPAVKNNDKSVVKVKEFEEKNPEVRKNELSERDVLKAVENANRALVFHNTQLEFSIHEQTKEIMVKVIDSNTKEIIREIPNEKILDMVAKLWELAGIFVDERR